MNTELRTQEVAVGSLKGCSQQACDRKAVESAILGGHSVYYCNEHCRIAQLKLIAVVNGKAHISIQETRDTVASGCDHPYCEDEHRFELNDGTGYLYVCDDHAEEGLRDYDEVLNRNWGDVLNE